MAEGGGLLNRYRVVKPYRGFESLSLRHYKGALMGAFIMLGEDVTKRMIWDKCIRDYASGSRNITGWKSQENQGSPADKKPKRARKNAEAHLGRKQPLNAL